MTKAPPTITVIAGTNGAGKSSIIGMYMREQGGEYFNPDEAARILRDKNPRLSLQDANGLAWMAGKDHLETAIQQGQDYIFETTLGGNTIKRLLQHAAESGHRVVVWYVGLNSPETHISRVAARVARGGHPIPEAKIRERFDRSLENLVELMPQLYEFKLFDNSQTVNLEKGEPPVPVGLLHIKNGEIAFSTELSEVPDWAKPVFAAYFAAKPSGV